MKDRALALAGVVQAAELVVRIAHHGNADEAALAASVASLFRFDAESTEAVFGDASALRPGLRALLSHLERGDAHTPAGGRIALTVLQVERKLVRRDDVLRSIAERLRAIEPEASRLGAADPGVLSMVGELYAGTVSRLSPRVMVQGNPEQLSQAAVVARIRAVLLAGMRSAVLWRQLGGSWWDLALRRRLIARAARGWLQAR